MSAAMLTAKDIAARVGCSESHAYRIAHRCLHSVGRRAIRVPESALAQFCERLGWTMRGAGSEQTPAPSSGVYVIGQSDWTGWP